MDVLGLKMLIYLEFRLVHELTLPIPDSLPQHDVQHTVLNAVHVPHYHVAPRANLVVTSENDELTHNSTSPANFLMVWWNMSRARLTPRPRMMATMLLRE